MIRLRCPRHPYYNCNRAPRASCEYCIALWEIALKPYNARLVYTPKKTKRPINVIDRADIDSKQKRPMTQSTPELPHPSEDMPLRKELEGR